jgi:hypothetical protein
MSSRAVCVVGMHRSGTSAIARGVNALSVDLGSNFFDLQSDNPTGYWEDRTIVGINQRVLEELRLKWDDAETISRERFTHHRIRLLRLKAVRYFNENFAARPLWGFKDPRTIRLLPFWIDALRDCSAEDAYVVAIRHPRSVAASLFRRQEIPREKADRLWLAHNVPFLHELRGKPLVVVDYDLLMQAPRAQLERIARKLELLLDDAAAREIERFTADFLDERLRHSAFAVDDFDATTGAGRLTHRAYAMLHDLASDGREPDARFWTEWEELQRRLAAAKILDGAP